MAKRASSAEMNKVDPDTVLDRYRALVPASIYGCIISVLDQPLPQAVRINQIKGIRPEDMHRWEKRYDWSVKSVPFCNTGWQVLSANTPPSRTVEHLMGAFYIQEASSMLPVELFDYDLEQTELILDLAASPGGKTTHLVDRSCDRGLVIANDASRSRIQGLRLALERWGAVNTAITCQPGDLFGVWFPGVFDKVLIDAPCSMEGLRTAESHPMRPITERERESLASRQTRLLISALRAVKIGGQVVYSTCTLAPEENEEVLIALKRKYGTAVEILTSRLSIDALPINLLEGIDFPELKNALRIWPHLFNTAGFFAALIQKNAPLDEDVYIQPPRRTWERQGWVGMNARAVKELVNASNDQYGLDLAQIVEHQALSFWKRNERIFAIPELFLERFRDFPVIACGMELGSMVAGGLLPSHEWAARFANRFTAGKVAIPPDLIPLWLKGSDLILQAGTENTQGSMVCLYHEDGLFIGRGKVLQGRIKNLLPRRLVA
jgi:16S rRNA (cytosine1407-C5)-methyltransferase